MIKLESTLKLERCPHCSVDNPNLVAIFKDFETSADNGTNHRLWGIYVYKRCGGVVIALSIPFLRDIQNIYPSPKTVNNLLPKKVRDYLQQAIHSQQPFSD